MISIEKAQRALAAIGTNPANYHYFFQRLEIPDWIEPLKRVGRFNHPPSVIREKGTIRFPTWPESQYLVRMAPLSPKEVCDVITSVPETDNQRVHEDFVDAALAMPVEMAVRVARSEEQWLRRQVVVYTLYPDKVGALMSHLARLGAIDEAIALGRPLLEIRGPENDEAPKEPERFRPPPEARPKFDHWHYRNVLEKNVPELVDGGGDKAFVFLLYLLETAVRIHSAHNHTPEEDYSWIWRPNIAHEHLSDLKEALVSAVRDGALQLSEKPGGMASVVDSLLQRRWRIFRRIAAYVLLEKATSDDVLTEMVLTAPVEYGDFPAQSPEFDSLLRARFGTLPTSAQSGILEIISKGPDLSNYIARNEREGKTPTPEELQKLANWWRVRWLFLIKDDLPSEWRKRYEDMAAEVGRGEYSPPRGASASYIGPTSPKSDDELKELSPGDLIEFLREWRPEGQWNSPTPEGLGRALAQLVASNPGALAEQAEKLRSLDPTYIRSSLDGFREAVKKGTKIAWEPVLKLCEWVVQQGLGQRDEKRRPPESDPDWSWTRSAIARLIGESLPKEGDARPSVQYREKVWRILEPLVFDHEPPVDESYPSGFMGYRALNTTRGVALDAAIHYGLWLRREIWQDVPKESGVLEKTPELRRVLDKSVTAERSPALLEVLGMKFPWVQVIDRRWAGENAERIFGPQPDGLGDSAWANYVMFCTAYNDVLPLVRPFYLRAINTIGTGFKAKFEDVDRHLVDHLMGYFWREKLTLSDELIQHFFASAPEKQRSYAFESLGRGLIHESNVEIPDQTLRRLRELWEWRFNDAKAKGRGSSEFVPFGWWFASGKFDTQWSLRTLLEVLQYCHAAELDHLVVKRLAETVGSFPLDSVEALGLLIENDTEGWAIHGWEDNPRTILITALDSGNAYAQKAAERVIHLLGARGHYGYRDLLKRSSG